ncbi:hypothetical protein RB195_011263 [Necator americanus]|uniref:Uncharacterized protein n=1 Tax=Necator americanus TaxID=51031 RepID=A0ABR1D2L4_NECAM
MRNFNTNMPTLDRSWRQPMDYALMSASRCGSLRDLEREIKVNGVPVELVERLTPSRNVCGRPPYPRKSGPMDPPRAESPGQPRLSRCSDLRDRIEL